MDGNDFDMLNGGNSTLFVKFGGVVGSHGGQMKNWRFCSYGNIGDKNHRYHLSAKPQGVR